MTHKGCLMLFLMLVYSLVFISLSFSEVLLYTGFEEDAVGKPPEEPADTWQTSGAGFEVDNTHAKNGSQSLGIMGGAGNQAIAAAIDTQSQLITVEFWLYLDGAERSLSLFILDPDAALTDWAAAGPYINWMGGKVRSYAGAWEEMGDFGTGDWHYVRLVFDTDASTFDLYWGDSIKDVHAEKPLGKDMAFRSNIGGAAGKVAFNTYDLASAAYIDDLLIYEGDVLPKSILAVEPRGKLAITWGDIRQ